MVATRKNFPLLEELLADQQRLETPVARFADAHAAAPSALPSLYRDLIPLSAPKPGEQYAFEVELDSCTGCKACVSACHSLNGLDDTETWRDVGLVVGGDWRDSFQQTVTTACHHCADPACLNGCPVLAYEKDPVTGIVRHLDDQCIGCQYCVLKCPYDVPKYNARLGIVRKCDMCHGRLAEGEAPACVQACPTQAIRIVTVSTTGVKETAEDKETPCAVVASVPAREGGGMFLKAAPAPEYTRPTTRYVSRREQPADLRAADAKLVRPQAAHWPLAVMLTLMPLAVGSQMVAAWANATGAAESVTYYVTLFGAMAGLAGLAASGFHLGQPWRAWRIFLGWRKSWLSREAMIFGAWMGLAGAAVLMPSLLTAAVAVGLAGLFCSVMVYVDTRRVFWKFAQTVPRFFGSVAMFAGAVAYAAGFEPRAGAWAMAGAALVRLACDARVLRTLEAADDETPPAGLLIAARLLNGPLRRTFGSKVMITLVAGLALPWADTPGWLVVAAVAGAELLERHLFFRAVDAPKMPGLPTAVRAQGGHA